MANSNFLTAFGLPASVIVAVVAVLAIIAYLRYQARQRAWSELAARTGLTLEPAGFLGLRLCVTGDYRGHTLTLDTFTRSSGKNSTTYTRIVLSVNNTASLRLALYEENILSPLGKALGVQDIQVGDAELDRRFMIKGQPEDVIVSLLTFGGLRDKLLQARSLNLKVEGQELHFEKRGVESDVDRLQFLFDLLSELAEAIERVGGPAFASTSDWRTPVATGR